MARRILLGPKRRNLTYQSFIQSDLPSGIYLQRHGHPVEDITPPDKQTTLHPEFQKFIQENGGTWRSCIVGSERVDIIGERSMRETGECTGCCQGTIYHCVICGKCPRYYPCPHRHVDWKAVLLKTEDDLTEGFARVFWDLASIRPYLTYYRPVFIPEIQDCLLEPLTEPSRLPRCLSLVVESPAIAQAIRLNEYRRISHDPLFRSPDKAAYRMSLWAYDVMTTRRGRMTSVEPWRIPPTYQQHQEGVRRLLREYQYAQRWQVIASCLPLAPSLIDIIAWLAATPICI